jgi:hypothetical protein
MAYTGPATGFCLAAAMFVCGATGLPTPPAQLPATSGSLTLGSSGSATFAPGQTLTLSGKGFAGNARVTVAMYSSPRVLASTVADSSGNVAATVTLPTDLLGRHTLIALGNGPSLAGRSLESVVDIETGATISPQTPTAIPQALAFTGFNVAAWILGGIGMLIAGFALIRTAVFRRKLVPSATGTAAPPLTEII